MILPLSLAQHTLYADLLENPKRRTEVKSQPTTTRNAERSSDGASNHENWMSIVPSKGIHPTTTATNMHRV